MTSVSVSFKRLRSPALGQTATWQQVRATSALPPQSRHALTRLARQFRATKRHERAQQSADLSALSLRLGRLADDDETVPSAPSGHRRRSQESSAIEYDVERLNRTSELLVMLRRQAGA